jgi:hypothetical protein
MLSVKYVINVSNNVVSWTCQNGKDIGGCIQKFPDWVITKYMLTFGIIRWEATQRVMAAKPTRLTHKIAIYLHLVAESCTICSSCSRRPVRKLLNTPSYYLIHKYILTFFSHVSLMINFRCKINTPSSKAATLCEWLKGKMLIMLHSN